MKLAISLAFLFLITVPSVGQMNEWYKNSQTRQAHALQLQRDFEALNAQIPTLSPDEEVPFGNLILANISGGIASALTKGDELAVCGNFKKI